MRFMTMIKADANSEAERPPDPKLMAAMAVYTEKMMKAGTVLEVGGLAPSSRSARVQVSGPEVTVIDGPFTETKELIAGYAIIEAATLAEAIEHAKSFLALHVEILGPSYAGECEVRPLFRPQGPGGCM